MNISLNTWTGDTDSIQSDIEEHRHIMASTDVNIVGASVLIPEGPNYPGSYQVWSPVDDTDGYGWVYVTPDGVIVRTDDLPTAEDMEATCG